MRTLCTLAIMIAGAGLIAGVPSRYAQACDDDRYPCPVRELAVQETANAPAKPAPQPKTKVNHTPANEEASAKREAAAPANVSKPAIQEQAMQKAAEAGLAAVAAAPADDESRGESRVRLRQRLGRSLQTARVLAGRRPQTSWKLHQIGHN